MTREEIEFCVEKWQQRLWLGAWRIEFAFDTPPEEEGADATIERAPDYERALLRFAAGWRDWTTDAAGTGGNFRPSSLDHLVCHELLHLVFHDLTAAGKLEFGQLSRDLDRKHDADIDHHVERVVDRLAAILVQAYAPSQGGAERSPSP